MPLYEYYCNNCEGIFDALRSMREAADPAPCPVCDGDAARIMPTSFTAFSFRDGMPRRIPDSGGHWHLGKAVSKPITGEGVAYEHPEIKTEQHPDNVTKVVSKGDKANEKEKKRLERRHLRMLRKSKVPVALGKEGPVVSPKEGASGHVD